MFQPPLGAVSTRVSYVRPRQASAISASGMAVWVTRCFDLLSRRLR
jgi:hypothetical protein